MLRIILVMVVLLSFIAQPVGAAKHPPSVPDQVNKVNVFNRTTDSLSVIGKTDMEKAGILKHRKEERRRKRLQSLQQKKHQAQERKADRMTRDLKKLKGL